MANCGHVQGRKVTAPFEKAQWIKKKQENGESADKCCIEGKTWKSWSWVPVSVCVFIEKHNSNLFENKDRKIIYDKKSGYQITVFHLKFQHLLDWITTSVGSRTESLEGLLRHSSLVSFPIYRCTYKPHVCTNMILHISLSLVPYELASYALSSAW